MLNPPIRASSTRAAWPGRGTRRWVISSAEVDGLLDSVDVLGGHASSGEVDLRVNFFISRLEKCAFGSSAPARADAGMPRVLLRALLMLEVPLAAGCVRWLQLLLTCGCCVQQCWLHRVQLLLQRQGGGWQVGRRVVASVHRRCSTSEVPGSYVDGPGADEMTSSCCLAGRCRSACSKERSSCSDGGSSATRGPIRLECLRSPRVCRLSVSRGVRRRRSSSRSSRRSV